MGYVVQIESSNYQRLQGGKAEREGADMVAQVRRNDFLAEHGKQHLQEMQQILHSKVAHSECLNVDTQCAPIKVF